MKKLYFKYLKSTIYSRWNTIRLKKRQRRQSILSVMDQLQEFNDIPLSQQLPGICQLLQIKQNNAAEILIWRLCCGEETLQTLEKKIPLPLKITIKK